MSWSARGRLVEASTGDLTGHFLETIKRAHVFCTHGVYGNECGYGMCVDGIRCVCDEGYVHDFGFTYYPNCFTPWYIYLVTHVLVILMSLTAVIYGVYVYRRLPTGPATRVATGVIIFAGLYFATMVAHSIEAHFGLVTDVLHGTTVIFFLAYVVSPCMDLYLSPAFQFSHSKAYIAFKHLMFAIFVVFVVTFFAACIEGQRRLLYEYDLKGYNDMRAFAHTVMAIFSMVVFFSFHMSSRKVISYIEDIHRNRENQDITSTAAIAEQSALSELARGHLRRVKASQSIVGPIMTSVIFCDLLMVALHWWNGVFRYQYLLFVSVVPGSPTLALLLLWLVSHHAWNRNEPVSNNRINMREGPEPMEGAAGNIDSAAGLVFRRSARRRAQEQQGHNREADSASSVFALATD